MDSNNGDSHFSCSLSAVLIDHVRGKLGEEGVERLLSAAGTSRSREYLEDLGNWISFDEAMALFDAGKQVTGDERFAYNIGVEAAQRLAGSSVAALLRSLGSTEAVYGQLAKTAQKFNTVTDQVVDEVRPGYARLRVGPREGFPRSRMHCEHTMGLFSCTPMLFGLAPAKIEHRECSVDPDVPYCVYEITWDPTKSAVDDVDDPRVAALQTQLDAMTKRLQGVFATTADLIASEDIDVTLARITDRAASEVRAPRHLLVVRDAQTGRLHIHHHGLGEVEARQTADRVLNSDADSLPSGWLVADVRSNRCDYGRLIALYESDDSVLPEERELLEVYSRYAATALDSATSLLEARRRHAEANALLELAQSLATTSSCAETALRLSENVPAVVNCDRADLLNWDERHSAFVRCDGAVYDFEGAGDRRRVDPFAAQPFARRLSGEDAPAIFIDADAVTRDERRILRGLDATAAALVPIRSNDRFLGALVLWVENDAERLRNTPELTSLLAGVAAHATSALENGILLDAITHQARHDGLTGLVNRSYFADRLTEAARLARAANGPFSLFYIDIDLFKSINDNLGHDAGDELLRQVADRLRGCVREDDMVARLGGDEYAVIVGGATGEESADRVAKRIATAFDRPFMIAGRSINVNASVGRANLEGDTDRLDALVTRADAAMYEIKRSHHQMSVDAAAA